MEIYAFIVRHKLWRKYKFEHWDELARKLYLVNARGRSWWPEGRKLLINTKIQSAVQSRQRNLSKAGAYDETTGEWQPWAKGFLNTKWEGRQDLISEQYGWKLWEDVQNKEPNKDYSNNGPPSEMALPPPPCSHNVPTDVVMPDDSVSVVGAHKVFQQLATKGSYRPEKNQHREQEPRSIEVLERLLRRGADNLVEFRQAIVTATYLGGSMNNVSMLEVHREGLLHQLRDLEEELDERHCIDRNLAPGCAPLWQGRIWFLLVETGAMHRLM